jgi:ribonuclease P protein component
MRVYGSLRRRNEFARVQRRGKRRVGQQLVLLVLPGRDRNRFGITITKATGNAVVRNRLRRRIKAVLDRQPPLAHAPYRDYVFLARAGAGEAPFAAIRDDVERLLGLETGPVE